MSLVTRIYLHCRWPASPSGAPLTPDILARLRPYVTRYAQTLQSTVFAVGGAPDHLHLLLEMPPIRTVKELTDELQAASGRFVREVLQVPDFAWHHENAGFVESVGVEASEAMGDYIHQNWEIHATGTIVPQWEAVTKNDPNGDADPAAIPQWLQDAMKDKEKR